MGRLRDPEGVTQGERQPAGASAGVSMDLAAADVVIIGAGVTGLSAGWWLAGAGTSVAVIDKSIVGEEASGRNGGIIGRRGGEPAVAPLGAESLRLWPQMDEMLGYPTEFRSGSMFVIADPDRASERIDRLKKMGTPGSEMEFLDARTVREWVPLVSPDIAGAMHSRVSGHANPHRSAQAFAWAYLDRGGRLYQDTTVTGFGVEGDRVTSVETDRGSIECDVVVCAAGPQTGVMAEMVGAFVPVSPARIEMIVTAPVQHMWQGTVGNEYLYGRQTVRGNLAYGGGPREWVDVTLENPRKPTTPFVRNLARRVAELFPGAVDVPVIRAWSGLLEWTPDKMPILDFLEQPRNFLVANVAGHGFGLSPATGKVISELVLSGESSVPIDDLGMGRFSGFSRAWKQRWDWDPDSPGGQLRAWGAGGDDGGDGR